MSQTAPQTSTQSKTKTIAKTGNGSGVRLWVRAKFLGFRRYQEYHLDPKFNKMSIKQSSDSKVSMTELPLNTTSVRELPMYTVLSQVKRTPDSKYSSNKIDHLGKNQQSPWKHWSCSR